jgi:hypothetical protein
MFGFAVAGHGRFGSIETSVLLVLWQPPARGAPEVPPSKAWPDPCRPPRPPLLADPPLLLLLVPIPFPLPLPLPFPSHQSSCSTAPSPAWTPTAWWPW